MLVCFLGDFFHLTPSDGSDDSPESPPRFMFWRRSAVITCSAASAANSCAGMMLEEFVIMYSRRPFKNHPKFDSDRN